MNRYSAAILRKIRRYPGRTFEQLMKLTKKGEEYLGWYLFFQMKDGAVREDVASRYFITKKGKNKLDNPLKSKP